MTGSVVSIGGPPAQAWWKSAVVYQVYPRSFADASGPDGIPDGIGDLAGLIGRLDHLRWLGIDALWISPIFRSPMNDFGYDVSDYTDVDPLFGTIADVDRLIAEAHAREIRIILDWVPNHTSDQHPWFQQSRQDRTNPKADWYVWRDEPANNWRAALGVGEPAWAWDVRREQYYLRCFLRSQPDLNWDEPDVEAAMLDTLRFWLDRGVDGFRMDVIHLIAKNVDHDDPPEAVADGRDHVTFNDVPAVHDRLRRIRGVLDEYDGDRVGVGEVYLLDEAVMAEYYGKGDELNLSFNFSFLWAQLDAEELRRRIVTTLSHLDPRGAWPTWVLSNHDVTRHRQRYGGREDVARVAAVMLLTLPGTPFVYQGEELGLVDAHVPPERIVDPGGRDGCRAPIPWARAAGHGWPVDPWLPFPPEAVERSVEAQRADPSSILNLYRRILALRRATPALHLGSFRLLDGSANLLTFERELDGDRWTVCVNPSAEPAITDPATRGSTIAISTGGELDGRTLGEHVPARTAIVAGPHMPV